MITTRFVRDLVLLFHLPIEEMVRMKWDSQWESGLKTAMSDRELRPPDYEEDYFFDFTKKRSSHRELIVQGPASQGKSLFSFLSPGLLLTCPGLGLRGSVLPVCPCFFSRHPGSVAEYTGFPPLLCEPMPRLLIYMPDCVLLASECRRA